MITEGFAALTAPDEPYAVARMLRTMGTLFRIPVVGNSMRPIMQDGDHVRVPSRECHRVSATSS